MSPICSPSVSISRTAARKWPFSVSPQRPYGSPSCGGSAAKLITNRSVGGIAAEAYLERYVPRRRDLPPRYLHLLNLAGRKHTCYRAVPRGWVAVGRHLTPGCRMEPAQ